MKTRSIEDRRILTDRSHSNFFSWVIEPPLDSSEPKSDMLKLTSVIMGTLLAASIAQPTLAATNTSSSPVVARPADNLQAQLIIKIGGSSHNDDRDRYYSYQRERERIERARWEAKRRRYQEYREYRERYRDRYDDDRRDYYRH
jgi:hypothetical protein